MTPPNNEHISVREILGAGRGVIATQTIASGTQLLHSESPAAHIVFSQYRKEVCAQCFHYDNGRRLAVRDNATGKEFCSRECETKWKNEQGEIGIEAWKSLHAFVQARSRHITNCHGLPSSEARPNEQQIDEMWNAATTLAENQKKPRQPQSVDPDILGFFLSGAVLHRNRPEIYAASVPPLAYDATPYRSLSDLLAHTTSYVQLYPLVPTDLRPSLTGPLCHALIAASSHNAFGIHSEDGEEYMGYALHPDASYFNHSCKPNMGKQRVGRGWRFWVTREIEEGEECCITYLGGDEKELNVEKRRCRLKEFWGFECGCRRCNEEDGDR